MPLRVTGPRALLKPIMQTAGSDLIALTDRHPPTVGQIIGLGVDRCIDCAARRALPFTEGDVVLIPAAAGQRITIDGASYWIVGLDQILGFWESAVTPVNDEARHA